MIEKGNLKAAEMLSKGFSIANDYRVLWLFGLFVIFPTIGLGAGVRRLLQALTEAIPGFSVVSTIFVVALLLMRIISSAGLIEALADYFQGSRGSARSIFRKGAGRFLPMFLLHLMMFVALLLVSVLLGLVGMAFRRTFGTEGCLNAGILSLLAVGWIFAWVVLGITFAFTQRFAILDGTGLWVSWRSGWKLFSANRGFGLRLGAIQVGVTILGTLGMGIAAGVATRTPFVGTVAVLLLLIALNGFFGGTFHSMYTRAFFELTRPQRLPDHDTAEKTPPSDPPEKKKQE